MFDLQIDHIADVIQITLALPLFAPGRQVRTLQPPSCPAMLSLTRLLPTPQTSNRAFSTSAALFAHKKGAGSTKNNRGSIGRRLGVKKFAGPYLTPSSSLSGKALIKLLCVAASR